MPNYGTKRVLILESHLDSGLHQSEARIAARRTQLNKNLRDLVFYALHGSISFVDYWKHAAGTAGCGNGGER